MFLLRWLREYYVLKAELMEKEKELKYCESCETLKLQLAIANDEKKMLLSRLIDKPEPVREVEQEIPKPLLPARMNWAVRRQMLEAEDRVKARIIKENEQKNAQAEPQKPLTVSEIEKELGVENG